MTIYLRFLLIIAPALYAVAAYAHKQVVVIPLSGQEGSQLQNVITVSNNNGDFSSISDALNSIDETTNQYLILIGPGTYMVNSQIEMKPNVHISGSGRSVTVLKSRITTDETAFIKGSQLSSISNLSVEINSSNTYPTKTLMTCSDLTGCSVLKNAYFSINSDSSSRLPIGVFIHNTDVAFSNIEIKISGSSLGNNAVNSSAFHISEGTLELRNVVVEGDIKSNGLIACGYYCTVNVFGSKITAKKGVMFRVNVPELAALISVSNSTMKGNLSSDLLMVNDQTLPIYSVMTIKNSSIENTTQLATNLERIKCVNSSLGLKELTTDCSTTI